jgi:AraC-like DNA-binding protein
MIDDTLAELAYLATMHGEMGETHTAVPRLAFRRNLALTKPIPALFEPVFYLVLSGAKRVTMASNARDYGTGAAAVAAVGLPFISQVTDATPERPYIGARLLLDPGCLTELLLDLPGTETEASSFAAAPVERSVLEAFARLARLLDTPADIPVLAPVYERELYYRLLQGALGATLRQIGRSNTRFGQIRAAAEWVRTHADQPMRVEDLARSVGMSATSFHRHFRAVTGYSPLAYQRHIRLVEARRLLAAGATSVTGAAFASGYASTPQFSREYRRMFGVPPSRDARLLAG